MFGNIFSCKHKILARLGKVQKALQRRSNSFLWELEKELLV